MADELGHGTGGRSRASLGDASAQAMRVCLFTDTLGDVNGVCRFIQNVAHQANASDRDLQVITSTAFKTPEWPNIHNLEPIFATKMPKYEQLEIVLPPALKMIRLARTLQPDAIHISTPGPVGVAGRIAARRLGVPVLGVYHTDFPAYVDHLFDDSALTWLTGQYMKWFYGPFSSIFTRSDDYMDALEAIGMDRDRMVRLLPGIETSRFDRSFMDPGVWKRIASEAGGANEGLEEPSVRVLYIGRVSIEKSLPMLRKVWPRVRERCATLGENAKLVIVGDGPYRARMAEELAGMGVHFLGFRHGEELSRIYASSDLFVFPSTTDTLGQVVMESQSSGLPVIVTDQGGPREVVDHGRTGFVLETDDSNAWVDTIVDLACDGAKRRSMGDAAAASMECHDIVHSFEHFWTVHEQAWKRSLEARGIAGAPKSIAQGEYRASSGIESV